MSKQKLTTEYYARRYPRKISLARLDTAWLDETPRHANGKFYWGEIALLPHMLPNARRRLSEAAKRLPALGWLKKRTQRLELAYRLVGLPENPVTPADYARWLVAEAVCTPGVPCAPVRKLVEMGVAALPELLNLVGQNELPREVSCLAALVAGANCRARASDFAPDFEVEILNRLFTWGKTNGLPPEPALYVHLLMQEGGEMLAERYRLATGSPNIFRPEPVYFLKLVLSGQAETAIEIAEAARELATVEEKVQALAGTAVKEVAYYNKQYHKLYKQNCYCLDRFNKKLAGLAVRYVQKTHDAQILRLLQLYVEMSVERVTYKTAKWEETILATLEFDVENQPELARAYFELLVGLHETIWSEAVLKSLPEQNRLQVWYNLAVKVTEGIKKLLEIGRNPAWISKLARPYFLSDVSLSSFKHAWQIRELAWFTERFDLLNHLYVIKELQKVIRNLAEEDVKKYLRPFVFSTEVIPETIRYNMLGQILDEIKLERRVIIETLPRITRYARQLGDWLAKFDPPCFEAGWPTAFAAADIDRQRPDPEVWLKALTAELEKQLGLNAPERKPVPEFSYNLIQTANNLALAVVNEPNQYRQVLSLVFKRDFEGKTDYIRDGLKVLQKSPQLGRGLYHILFSHYADITRVINSLGEVEKLTKRHPNLADLPGEFELEKYPAVWRDFVAAYPQLNSVVNLYLSAKTLTGGDLNELPASLAHEMRLAERLQTELAHLEARDTGQKGRAIRLANLRAQLADTSGLAARVASAVNEKMPHLAGLATLEAVRVAINKAYSREVGRLVPGIGTADDNLVNAMRIYCDTEDNRNLLLRLMRAEGRGETHWRYNLPANAKFAEKLDGAGINRAIWTAENAREVVLGGKKLRLYIETRPLEVLHMGNYFDTCLAASGCNNFSTIANACDLNKRVIYAADETGYIWARKLVALNNDLQLVGFKVYSRWSQSEQNKELWRLFDEYCRDFAQKCGIKLYDGAIDSYTIPNLASRDWYDDGAVAWFGEVA
jgi:hypothetical protein